jgi:Lrp/AsnC family leucine-responsive transcriptional regulator
MAVSLRIADDLPEFATLDEVIAAYAMSGSMDDMLHVVAEDLDAHADFALTALLRLPGV